MGSCFSDLQVKQSSSDLQLLIANHFKASSAQCMRGSTIFFVSLFWCSFHFSQPCSLQFSLPIVYLFPALWQSLVDNVSRAPPPPINRRLLDEWRKTGTKCGQNCTWSLISNPHPLNITAIIILVIHMALSKWGLPLDPRDAC